jgi:hypothetical protein
MKKIKIPRSRLIKYLEEIEEKDVKERNVEEIVVSFRNPDLRVYGIYRAHFLMLLVESGIWKKHDNKHDIRFDNRPINQGGPQLHIKNRHSGVEWAYRNNGTRSEKSRFTAPSTKDVRNIVRNYFNISNDVIIESQFLGFSSDGKQLLIEIYR